MFSSPAKITALAAGLTVSLAALGGTVHAQGVSNDVVARCAQIVGAMKFEGTPAERNHDMMTLGCRSSGGRIPGAPAETQLTQSRQFTTRNVALPRPHAFDSGDWMARASQNYGGGY